MILYIYLEKDLRKSLLSYAKAKNQIIFVIRLQNTIIIKKLLKLNMDLFVKVKILF